VWLKDASGKGGGAPMVASVIELGK
jgi:hypothetical protein